MLSASCRELPSMHCPLAVRTGISQRVPFGTDESAPFDYLRGPFPHPAINYSPYLTKATVKLPCHRFRHSFWPVSPPNQFDFSTIGKSLHKFSK